MAAFTSILFPTDFSEDSRNALAGAVALARSAKSKIRAIHVVPPPAGDAEVARAQDQLDRAVPRELDDVVVERKVVHSAAPDIGILDAARDAASDLIVLATHGHRGIKHALLGSVAERVVQLAPCAVMSIRHGSRAPDPARRSRILCAVDFSEPSKHALEVAVDLAKQTSAELIALHVVEPVIYPVEYGMVAVSVAELERGALTRARTELNRLVTAAVKDAVRARACVESGAAFERICDRARADDCDLIVVATHGLTGLKHLLIGSTAERVVRSADRPVLTVKGPAASKA